MNHYDSLKVTSDAPTEVIRAAYRALAGKLHPDRQGGTGGRDDEMHDQMAALNAAYEVLVDANLRAEYDASLIAQATAIEGLAPADQGPDSDQGFSETRVDIDWMGPRVVGGPAPFWPPSRNVLILMSAAGVLLLLAVVVTTWQLVIRHQMDQALSDQYSAHPQRPMTGDGDVEPFVPQPELRAAPPLPAPVPASRPESLPSAARGVSNHAPTVAELEKMSDEQLLEVLPTLGDPDAPPRVSFSKPAGLFRHPLDGKPLNLRTEKYLVDPLSP